jgi:L-ascorbate metabolism protein UlaG (beta-lactamase superfamily)
MHTTYLKHIAKVLYVDLARLVPPWAPKSAGSCWVEIRMTPGLRRATKVRRPDGILAIHNDHTDIYNSVDSRLPAPVTK